MDTFELKKTLKSDCERLLRVEALAPEEKTKYAGGIAKLEKRIEELRAALSFTLDDFARMYREDIEACPILLDNFSSADYDTLNHHINEAESAWKRGDMEAHALVRQKIRDALRIMGGILK